MEEKKGSPAGSGFWQIIFPALVFGILIILVCIWVVIGVGDGNISRFAELSTVLLVLPVLFFSLFVIIILGAGIVLVGRIMQKIPPVTQRILEFLTKIQGVVGKITNIIVQPVIRPWAILGGFRDFISGNRSRFRIE